LEGVERGKDASQGVRDGEIVLDAEGAEGGAAGEDVVVSFVLNGPEIKWHEDNGWLSRPILLEATTRHPLLVGHPVTHNRGLMPNVNSPNNSIPDAEVPEGEKQKRQ
jgi:hypothetical protein